MGEYADDILNGDVDEQTGEWIGGGQGFPRTKRKPFNNKHSRELYGILNYLNGRRLTNWQDVIQKYNKEVLQLPMPFNNEQIAAEIQKDFGKFSQFVNQKLIPNGNNR